MLQTQGFEMKVVFLDIDGTLNSSDYLYKDRVHFSSTSADEKIDPEAVRRLNAITDATGSVIVVSSAWRIGKRVADLRGLLSRHGVTAPVVGATPVNGLSRGSQIGDWMSGREIESFVILDDDNDMGALSSSLVQTTFSHGLLDEHVTQAIEILGKK